MQCTKVVSLLFVQVLALSYLPVLSPLFVVVVLPLHLFGMLPHVLFGGCPPTQSEVRVEQNVSPSDVPMILLSEQVRRFLSFHSPPAGLPSLNPFFQIADFEPQHKLELFSPALGLHT